MDVPLCQSKFGKQMKTLDFGSFLVTYLITNVTNNLKNSQIHNQKNSLLCSKILDLQYFGYWQWGSTILGLSMDVHGLSHMYPFTRITDLGIEV